MNVPKATCEVYYNGKNITADISAYMQNLTYTDKTGGEADELEIVLDDTDNNWKTDWYPDKGATLRAYIMFEGKTLDCGEFTIDETNCQGSRDGGDTFVIRALAAGIDKKIRTKKSHAHENKTLRQIAQTIASAHGFTIQGEIKGVTIKRKTQYRKTDLNFLKSLAEEYGYTFTIKGKKLVFTDMPTLEKRAAVLTIERSDLISWDISNKTSDTFKDVDIKYHNAQQKKVIQYRQDEENKSYTTKKDTLQLHLRSENKQHAEIKARAALYNANSMQQTGTLSIPGNVIAVAGNNLLLSGLHKFDGLQYITEAQHSLSGNGEYLVQLAIKRISN